MWKINLSLVLVAIAAISISRKMRMSQRYERAPKKLDTWKSLDRGIDPTQEEKQ